MLTVLSDPKWKPVLSYCFMHKCLYSQNFHYRPSPRMYSFSTDIPIFNAIRMIRKNGFETHHYYHYLGCMVNDYLSMRYCYGMYGVTYS